MVTPPLSLMAGFPKKDPVQRLLSDSVGLSEVLF